jgi:hypothetical protein
MITPLMVVLGLSLATMNASAGPLITGTGALSEALKEVKILLSQSTTLSRTLAQINNAFRNLENGLGDLLDEARNLLQACDGEFDCEDPETIHEIKLLLEQAQRDKAMILVISLGEFFDFLHEFEVGLGEVEGKIGGLKEIGKIRVSDAIYMEIKLNSCNQIVTLIDSEVEELAAYLEDGDDGEDPNDPDPSSGGADDVNDFIAIALKGLSLEEGLDDVDWALANAQAVLDQAIAVKEDIEFKKVSACRSNLKLVQKKLEKLARAQRFGAPRLSESVTTLARTEARVYSLSGQLVSVGPAQALSRDRLASGVYVVVYSDGRAEKLVVLH